MKRALLIALLLLPGAAFAQEAAVPADASTVVTSDLFRLNLGEHQGVFTEHVVVSSPSFHMTTQEMTVFFSQTDGNKVERMLARGEVRIETDGREAKAAQAEYTVADDRLVLTGSPQITQGKDIITGTKIILYRRTNRLEVEGRSRVVLSDIGMSGSPASTAPAKTDKP